MWSPKRFGKEAGVVMPMGGGGITINLGTVDSPYKKAVVEDITTAEVK